MMDSLKNNNKLSTDPSLATKLSYISELFERLHYVIQFSYTLLRDQLSHVSCLCFSITLLVTLPYKATHALHCPSVPCLCHLLNVPTHHCADVSFN